MLKTSPRTPAPAPHPGMQPAPAAPRAITPPPRRRRSLWGVLAGALLVIAGAVLAGWLFQSRGGHDAVLAVRQDIARGAVIRAEDLVTAHITTDPALRPLPADAAESIVGLRATHDLAAGSLVTPDSAAELLVPQQGTSVVGLSVTPAMAPGMTLEYGDRVRVILTTGPQDDPNSPREPIAALVVAVHAGAAGTTAQGSTTIDVQVAQADAALLADRAAAGQIAVVLDSRES